MDDVDALHAEDIEPAGRKARAIDDETHYYGDGHDHGLPIEAALARGEEVRTVTFVKQDPADDERLMSLPWTNMRLDSLSALGHYLTDRHAEVLREVMEAGGDLAQVALQVLTDQDERLESVRNEGWPV